jgi:hypothetical protein
MRNGLSPQLERAKAKTLAVSENPASEAQKERREREKEGQSADLHFVSTQSALEAG